MDAKLRELVEKDRTRSMSKEQRAEQRIGFAYGNAPKNDKHTRETIRDIANAQDGLNQTRAR